MIWCGGPEFEAEKHLVSWKFQNTDTKDKVSVWAGIITLAVLQVSDRVDTELNIYGSDWTGAIGAIGGYVIGFAILYAVARWLLERYFKRKPQPQPTPPPPFGTPLTT